MNSKAGILALLLACLPGCVRPQHEDPHAHMIRNDHLGLGALNAPLQPEKWWRAFGDEQLNTLVEASLASHPSLEQALARVRAAQAANFAAEGALRPNLSFSANETRERFAATYYYPPPYGGHSYWVGQVGSNLDWSLDFWGRQSALIHQTRATVASAELDRFSARLALSGSISQAYIDLYRAYELEDIAVRAEAQRRQLLQLTRARVSAGLDTQVELNIAAAAVPQAQGARLQAASERDLAVHRLAALAGRGADLYTSIVRPTMAVDAALQLPLELPMDLLSRRPDVVAARDRVEAATFGRSAATAAFYPDVSLNAFAGFQAIGLDALFKSGSKVYGAGPTLYLPIFDARQLRANYKSVTAELDSAIASYNDTVLSAVRQSADQISLGASLLSQIARASETLNSTEIAFKLAQDRYAAGLGTQLVVLNAESQVLAARRDLVALRANLVVARITLLLTLGGSFNPQAPIPIASAGASP